MKNWILRKFFPAAHEAARELAQAEKLMREYRSKHYDNLEVIARLSAERNVSWPRPATRIPAHVVLKEFNVPLDRGLAAALHQELDDQIQDLLDVVSQPPSPTLTAEHRLHLAGGIEHLRLFQKRILDLASRASTADADLEDEQKKPE